MSQFFSSRFSDLVPYVPGEQPQNRKFNKLNTNESPFPPSPLAQRMAREAAGDCQLYSDPDCRSLISTAAEYFHVSPDEILFGNGSDENLNFAFMAFCDDNCPCIFPDISYGFYPVFAQINHLPYRIVPLREDYRICPKDYMTDSGTIFIANPNAPTGIALTRDEIESILKANPNHVVVIDEAYVDFGGESCLPLIHSYPNLIVIQTFSKSRSLAGARLGMTFGNKKLIADMNAIKFSLNPYNINRMTMAAGVGALLDDEYFQKNLTTIIETRNKTVKQLESLGFQVLESKANFVFTKHPSIAGKELYEALKERGILIRHFEKERLFDFNRITIGSQEQMDDLLKNIREILEVKK